MAIPTPKVVRGHQHKESDNLVEALRTQVNNLTASLRLLTAKLDADAGVTDTNYNALITDDAIATAPAVVNKAVG